MSKKKDKDGKNYKYEAFTIYNYRMNSLKITVADQYIHNVV